MRKIASILAVSVVLLLGVSSAPARAESDAAEITFWESIRNSKVPAEFEAYLKAYPQGQFAPLARIRLNRLKVDAAAKSGADKQPKSSSAQQTGQGTLSAEVAWKKVALKAKMGGAGNHGVLGVQVSNFPQGFLGGRQRDTKGALVISVRDASAAKAAGIKPADVMISIDHQPIEGMRDLVETAGKTRPGKIVDIVVLRLDVDQAIRQYPLACEKGDANACATLSLLYRVKRDKQAAFAWALKAAERDHLVSMSRVAGFYHLGHGVAKDEAKAVEWYRKAAEKGDAQAMFSLGVMTEFGRGVAKDYAAAVGWYRKAAEKGVALAMNNLGAMYARGRGVAKDEAAGIGWYRKAAEKGVMHAMYNLGHAYEFGRGVAKNSAEAIKWYREAAEKGSPEAIERLRALGVDVERSAVKPDSAGNAPEAGIADRKKTLEPGKPASLPPAASNHDEGLGKLD